MRAVLGRRAPSRAAWPAVGRSKADLGSCRSGAGRLWSSPRPRARRRSPELMRRTREEGVYRPPPARRSRAPVPFPSPLTQVDVNRTCGCSATSKKSAARRCLSRAEMPVSTLAASIVSSISWPAGPTTYEPSNPRKRPRTVCRPQKCSTSNWMVVRLRSTVHLSSCPSPSPSPSASASARRG